MALEAKYYLACYRQYITRIEGGGLMALEAKYHLACYRQHITRIEGGGLMALEAKYYLACLAGLRNRNHPLIRQNHDSHYSHREDWKIQVKAIIGLIN